MTQRHQHQHRAWTIRSNSSRAASMEPASSFFLGVLVFWARAAAPECHQITNLTCAHGPRTVTSKNPCHPLPPSRREEFYPHHRSEPESTGNSQRVLYLCCVLALQGSVLSMQFFHLQSQNSPVSPEIRCSKRFHPFQLIELAQHWPACTLTQHDNGFSKPNAPQVEAAHRAGQLAEGLRPFAFLSASSAVLMILSLSFTNFSPCEIASMATRSCQWPSGSCSHRQIWRATAEAYLHLVWYGLGLPKDLQQIQSKRFRFNPRLLEHKQWSAYLTTEWAWNVRHSSETSQTSVDAKGRHETARGEKYAFQFWSTLWLIVGQHFDMVNKYTTKVWPI